MSSKPIERDVIQVKVVNIAGRGWGSDNALPLDEATVVLGTLGDFVRDETDPRNSHWRVTLRKPLTTIMRHNLDKEDIVARNDRQVRVGDVGFGGTLWVDMDKVKTVLGQ